MYPGAVLSNTLKHASRALQDVIFGVTLLVVGIACTFQVWLGAMGANIDFATHAISSVLRLSFGLSEYAEFAYGGRDRHNI